MSKAIRYIDETFQDKNVVRALKDYVFMLDAYEAVRKGTFSVDHVRDAMVTALFAPANNPFHPMLNSLIRHLVLDLMTSDTSELSDQFVEKAVPLVKSILNDATPRDYFSDVVAARRKLT